MKTATEMTITITIRLEKMPLIRHPLEWDLSSIPDKKSQKLTQYINRIPYLKTQMMKMRTMMNTDSPRLSPSTLNRMDMLAWQNANLRMRRQRRWREEIELHQHIPPPPKNQTQLTIPGTFRTTAQFPGHPGTLSQSTVNRVSKIIYPTIANATVAFDSPAYAMPTRKDTHARCVRSCKMRVGRNPRTRKTWCFLRTETGRQKSEVRCRTLPAENASRSFTGAI